MKFQKSTLKSLVVPNEEVWDCAYDFWDTRYETAFPIWEQKYQEFKKDVQKEVNYLVKEFECKKSADSYARATTLALVFLTLPNCTLSSSMMISLRK